MKAVEKNQRWSSCRVTDAGEDRAKRSVEGKDWWVSTFMCQEGRIGGCQLTNSSSESRVCPVLTSSSRSGSPAESTPRSRGRREWLRMTFAHVGGDHGEPEDEKNKDTLIL